MICLIIGMTIILFANQYSMYERSYDDFIPEKDQIYRVDFFYYQNNILMDEFAMQDFSFANLLKDNFPQIKESLRLLPLFSCYIESDKKTFFEKSYVSDSTFFEMFSVPIFRGQSKYPLNEPGTVAISESIAKKYFGSQDPIGKTLKIISPKLQGEYRIVTVYKDLPENSHLDADILFSCHEVAKKLESSDSKVFYTYFKLNKHINASEVEEQYPVWLKNNLSEIGMLKMKDNKLRYEIKLVPVKDIYLKTDDARDLTIKGNLVLLRLIDGISILMIIILIFNFSSIFIIKFSERSAEFKIKKQIGVNNTLIIAQLFFDSFILYFGCLLMSILFYFITAPLIKGYINSLYPSFSIFTQNFGTAILLFVLLGILFSIIISVILTLGFVKIRNRKQIAVKSKFFIRNIFSTLQMMITLICLISILVIYKQLRYIESFDVGYDCSNVLVIKRTEFGNSQENQQRLYLFKKQLFKNPEFENVTSSIDLFGEPYMAGGKIKLTSSYLPGSRVYKYYIDYNYLDFFKIRFLKGRNFRPDNIADKKYVILNELAAKSLGLNSLDLVLDRTVEIGADKYNVIGIIKNFYHEPLRKEPKALAFLVEDEYNLNLFVRLSPKANKTLSIGKLKAEWNKIFKETPFQIQELENILDNLYVKERQFMKWLLLLTITLLIINNVTLVGNVIQSIKEMKMQILIRKISGITKLQLIYFISINLIFQFFIVAIISSCIGYVVLNNWLNKFVDRISIDFLTFLIPTVIMFVIECICISYSINKASNVNPVDFLKTE